MKAKFYLFVFTTLIMVFILTLNSGLFAQEVRKPQKITKENIDTDALSNGCITFATEFLR